MPQAPSGFAIAYFGHCIVVQSDLLSEWYRRAAVACDPFIFPESRYRCPWVNEELSSGIESAGLWLRENPCPDTSIGEHVRAMLNAYAQMTTATVTRLMELREIIGLHSKFVDRRTVPRDRVSASAHTESDFSLVS